MSAAKNTDGADYMLMLEEKERPGQRSAFHKQNEQSELQCKGLDPNLFMC